MYCCCVPPGSNDAKWGTRVQTSVCSSLRIVRKNVSRAWELDSKMDVRLQKDRVWGVWHAWVRIIYVYILHIVYCRIRGERVSISVRKKINKRYETRENKRARRKRLVISHCVSFEDGVWRIYYANVYYALQRRQERARIVLY